MGNKQTENPSCGFYHIIGVCLDAVRAVFFQTFGYRHTYIHTERQT